MDGVNRGASVVTPNMDLQYNNFIGNATQYDASVWAEEAERSFNTLPLNYFSGKSIGIAQARLQDGLNSASSVFLTVNRILAVPFDGTCTTNCAVMLPTTSDNVGSGLLRKAR